MFNAFHPLHDPLDENSILVNNARDAGMLLKRSANQELIGHPTNY